MFRQRCRVRWEDKEVSWEGDKARRAGQDVLREGYIDKEFLEEVSCALNSSQPRRGAPLASQSFLYFHVLLYMFALVLVVWDP